MQPDGSLEFESRFRLFPNCPVAQILPPTLFMYFLLLPLQKKKPNEMKKTVERKDKHPTNVSQYQIKKKKDYRW